MPKQTSAEAELPIDLRVVDVYYVQERDLTRTIYILSIAGGRPQTFVESSGTSNQGSQSYPKLCYPISHITRKPDGSILYGKITPACIDNHRRTFLFKDPVLEARYAADDVCLKADLRLFKWQYFLIRDFINYYDPFAWKWLMYSHIVSGHDPEIRDQVQRWFYKLFHHLRDFLDMSRQYFATEEQIVCSSALSAEGSIWDSPGFIELREFIRQRDPALFDHYREIRDTHKQRGVPITDEELTERMKLRNAELLRRANINYLTLPHDLDPDEPGVKSEVDDQYVIYHKLNNRYAFERIAPPDAKESLQEPIFTRPLPPFSYPPPKARVPSPPVIREMPAPPKARVPSPPVIRDMPAPALHEPRRSNRKRKQSASPSPVSREPRKSNRKKQSSKPTRGRKANKSRKKQN